MKVILLRQPLVYLRSALIGFSPRRQKLFLTVAYSTTSERGGTKGGGVLRVERAEKGNTVFL